MTGVQTCALPIWVTGLRRETRTAYYDVYESRLRETPQKVFRMGIVVYSCAQVPGDARGGHWQLRVTPYHRAQLLMVVLYMLVSFYDVLLIHFFAAAVMSIGVAVGFVVYAWKLAHVLRAPVLLRNDMAVLRPRESDPLVVGGGAGTGGAGWGGGPLLGDRHGSGSAADSHVAVDGGAAAARRPGSRWVRACMHICMSSF